ncbi:hypothetical protein PGT21_021708 [Puccinia graminis f. sp. tritici]|uniref:Uncharacterized protein n=1 Tax=Puccinia graminis f. sp. tritici TaxID=56615 RepID=A0A5B0N198_PUCGR|nr:hypothetical protein PGT21_021708 [Puccinia graminis f. sp. tritici]
MTTATQPPDADLSADGPIVRRLLETPTAMATVIGALIQRGGFPPSNTVANIAPAPGRHIYGKLIRPNLAAYTRTHGTNGERFTNAPFPLIRAHVMAQPAAWQQRHLPIGLVDDDMDAIQNLDQFLRTMVKHERTTLRNLSDLTLVVEPLALFPNYSTCSSSSIKALAGHATLLVARTWPGETASQWEIIDRHLEMLAGLSPVVLQAHIELIIRKDAHYFDGSKYIGDIPRETFHLPTAAEVNEEVERLNRTPAAERAAQLAAINE